MVHGHRKAGMAGEAHQVRSLPWQDSLNSWYRVAVQRDTARYSAIQRDTARYRDPAMYYDLSRYVIFYDSAISNNTGQCANKTQSGNLLQYHHTLYNLVYNRIIQLSHVKYITI